MIWWNRAVRGVAALALMTLLAVPTVPSADAQDDPGQLMDLATAYECVSALGAATPLGPYAILVAMGTPPCVATLANGGLQGYALVQCVMQYPPAVCLGLE
jgi:hypothetical protein